MGTQGKYVVIKLLQFPFNDGDVYHIKLSRLHLLFIFISILISQLPYLAARAMNLRCEANEQKEQAKMKIKPQGHRQENRN